MATLNDLWQAFLTGGVGAGNRPTLASYNNAALTSPALVGAGQKRLVTYNLYNPNTTVAFVQLFNAATAGAVTLGTTAPTDWLAIPAGGVLDGQWDFSEAFPLGLVIAAATSAIGGTLPTVALPVSLGLA